MPSRALHAKKTPSLAAVDSTHRTLLYIRRIAFVKNPLSILLCILLCHSFSGGTDCLIGLQSPAHPREESFFQLSAAYQPHFAGRAAGTLFAASDLERTRNGAFRFLTRTIASRAPCFLWPRLLIGSVDRTFRSVQIPDVR